MLECCCPYLFSHFIRHISCVSDFFLHGTKSGILKMQIKTKKKERKKYEK